MKKRLDTVFITQLDQIVAQSKEILTANRKGFIAKSAASGTVHSGGFVKENLDMTISNIITVSDSILKYAIEYAANENLSLKKLVDVAAEKIKNYKSFEWDELENHYLIKPWLQKDGIRKIFEDERVKVDSALSAKVTNAYKGWLKQEKIYKKSARVWHEIWWVRYITFPIIVGNLLIFLRKFLQISI